MHQHPPRRAEGPQIADAPYPAPIENSERSLTWVINSVNGGQAELMTRTRRWEV